jgi:hypothetical protein
VIVSSKSIEPQRSQRTRAETAENGKYPCFFSVISVVKDFEVLVFSAVSVADLCVLCG